MGTQIVGYKPPPGSSERTKVVRLKVIRAQALAKKDIFGASDPYVRIDLVTSQGDDVIDSVLTQTKKRTLNPRWEEEFLLRLKPADHKIVLEVFDENRLTRDDFLGRVVIDRLNTSDPFGLIPREDRSSVTNNTKSYILQPRSIRSKVRGTLDLYLAYIEETTPPEDGGAASDTDQVEEPEPGWEMLEGAAAAGATAAPADTETGVDASAATDGVDHENQTQPLPAGWEERQDANGRTYYVNHIARTTQWQRPGTQEDEGASLASNLENAVIEAREQGRNFNRRHHMSVDERSNRDSIIEGGVGSNLTPSHTSGGLSTVDGDVGGSTGGQAQLQTSGSRSRGVSESDNTDNSTRRTGSVSGASSSTRNLNAEGLPSGWTLQVAPNGRVFFINHIAKKTTWIDPRNSRPSPLPSQTNLPNRKQDDLGLLPEGWEERVHTDGRIFFIDHNTRITQWEDPRISNPQIAGQAVPYSRDYKRKYEYLRAQLKKPSNVPNKIEIKVKRISILEDSYRQIHSIPSNKVDTLKTKLWIEFDGEVGLDYGGVAREWFYLLSKEMFNPYYGLFEYSATDNYTLQINPNSGVCNEDHLSYFKFIGRVAGMAVFHGKLLDGFFIRPFYKMMLGKQIELKDMESVDTEYYNSLLWIKENDPAELELPFQIDEESFGQTVSIELRPGGKEIKVTNENKDEYIQRVIEWRFINRVKKQMDEFLSGFAEIVPQNLLKIFDEGELELLMCGIGSIDVKDWKKNTTYKGDYHPNHIVIQWFWRVVLSFNNEMRSRLLQFVTGTSRVPMNGFKELYGSNGPQLFTIEKWGSPTSYPRAHTCFNRLDLPPYESYQQLRDKLVKAIEQTEGFAGVD